MGTEGRTLLPIGDEEELRLGLRRPCPGRFFPLKAARTGTEILTKAQLIKAETPSPP